MNSSDNKPIQYKTNFRCFSKNLESIFQFITHAGEKIYSYEIAWSAETNTCKFSFSADFLLHELTDVFAEANYSILMTQSLKVM